uniref:Uncharacterized protein n=1 Tax=Romanomermis culicivorax TaxID=13658 RepID=A0A915IUZ4_ROMCU
MTTSAVAKLIPKPPARVVNMKINFSLPGLLYSSIDVCKKITIEWMKLPVISRFFRWLKNPGYFPVFPIGSHPGVYIFNYRNNNLSKSPIFAQLSIKCWSVVYGGPGSAPSNR